jgi:hypothetical protein
MAGPDKSANGVLGALTTAASLSVAILVAEGYAIVFARTLNLGIPSAPILAALPSTYYVGEAAHSLVLPLVVVLTAGTIWLGYVVSGEGISGEGPSARSWVALGTVIAIYPWLLDAVIVHQGVGDANGGYVPVLIVVMIAIVLFSLALGRWSAHRFAKQPKRRERLKLATAMMIFLSVLGVSAIRVLDAGFLKYAVPAAFVSADPDDCPFLAEPHTHCFFRGIYFGESDQWMYLVQAPTFREKNDPHLDHLLLIPRADIRQAVIAEKFNSVPFPRLESLGPDYGPPE